MNVRLAPGFEGELARVAGAIGEPDLADGLRWRMEQLDRPAIEARCTPVPGTGLRHLVLAGARVDVLVELADDAVVLRAVRGD